MSTSNAYSFANTDVDSFLTEAFERCGILGDVITAQQLQSARRSLNLMLSSWPNNGINLWTVQQGMVALIPSQSVYSLPTNTIDILEATIRTTTRQLSGTPSSSSGVAENAFDGDPATACTETAPDGYIAYDYGSGNRQAISMVGIVSNTPQDYTLVVETSIDGSNWFTALTASEQSYPADVLIWLAVIVPQQMQFIRIRETGGATLDIQELYFNVATTDYILTRLGRAEYTALPQKYQTGRPSSFYVDRQINPNVSLWPTPTDEFTMMFYNAIRQIQDIDLLTQNADIPTRYFDALSAGLAVRLAEKYAIERYDRLSMAFDKAYSIAFREDTEKVNLRIYPNMDGWT